MLPEEKSALVAVMRNGVVSDDVGEGLLEAVDIKLDRVQSGETTVERLEEGYEEPWRRRTREFDLDVGVQEDGGETSEPASGGDA